MKALISSSFAVSFKANDPVNSVSEKLKETENLDMVREAVEAGADIIMLDNMDHDTMAEAIRIIDGRADTEVSGNVSFSSLCYS